MGVGAAILGAGVLGAGASVASGVIGSNAASSAAGQEVAAAERGQNIEQNQFNTTQANLQPFINAGSSAIPTLEGLLGLNTTGGSGGTPNTSEMLTALQNLPGYQFIKSQGLQAAESGFAGQGLAASGPALKGATSYATGLADSTYLNLLNPYQTLVNSGSNAAGTLAGVGLGTANAESGLATGAGSAAAAGTIGSANAITGTLGSLGGNASTTALTLALNNAGMFGNGTGSNPVTQFGWGTGNASVPQWSTGGGGSSQPF